MSTLASVATLLLALGVTAPVAVAEGTTPTQSAPRTISQLQATTSVTTPLASDRVLGRADAPVTIIEYLSYTCGHCADFTTNVMPELKTRYVDTGKVKVIFRDLPTPPYQISQLAAVVARCAAPERFFAVSNHLLTKQKEAFASQQIVPWFERAVALSGRTADQIDACTALDATQNSLQRDTQSAIDAGITSTPSVFVNGRRVMHTRENLISAIDALVN